MFDHKHHLGRCKCLQQTFTSPRRLKVKPGPSGDFFRISSLLWTFNLTCSFASDTQRRVISTGHKITGGHPQEYRRRR